MKNKLLVMALILGLACLASFSCVTSGETDGDNNDAKTPDFVKETCSGCTQEENIGNVTGIRFFSYVKNNGGSGKISMTIASGSNSATSHIRRDGRHQLRFPGIGAGGEIEHDHFHLFGKIPGIAGIHGYAHKDRLSRHGRAIRHAIERKISDSYFSLFHSLLLDGGRCPTVFPRPR